MPFWRQTGRLVSCIIYACHFHNNPLTHSLTHCALYVRHITTPPFSLISDGVAGSYEAEAGWIGWTLTDGGGSRSVG